jgi:hypothetical protein
MSGSERRGMVIQPRDERLLRELAVMRIIDREQAKAVAGFGSTRRVNARLLALHREGLLRRFFQGTEAGGQKALYALSSKGSRLIGAAHREFRYANDELLSTNFFVAHQLAVNRIYCSVKSQSALQPDARFVRWLAFSEPVAASLVPDGYFEVSVSDQVLGAFVEVDLGHEGLAVWKGKVQNYLRYAVSGRFEEQFHLPQFRVLVVANRDKRIQAIRAVVRRITDKIFWLSSFETIDRDGFWSSIWLRPADDVPKTLF